MEGTFKKVLAGALAATFVAGTVSAGGLLWDNNIDPNGFSGRAVSPPNFPAIRVADDFIVPDGTRWIITDFHWNAVVDSGWNSGDVMQVTVYEDTGNGPGAIIATRAGGFSSQNTGQTFFGRQGVDYWMDFSGITLSSGTYWIGVRHPDGSGSGTNYWMTSDGGPDGAGTSTGYFSLNNGVSWSNEGAGWQHAFEITGVPAPGALALLGLGGLVGARRRRR